MIFAYKISACIILKNVDFKRLFYFSLYPLQFALLKHRLCLKKKKPTLNTELLQYCMFPFTLVHRSKCFTRHTIIYFNSNTRVCLFIIHSSR